MRLFQLIEVVYRNLWLLFLALALVFPVLTFGEFWGWLAAEPDTSPVPNQNRMLAQLLVWLVPLVLHLALLACALMLKPKGFWFWTPAQKRTSALRFPRYNPPMRIDVLTLFPGVFDGVLSSSILKRAAESVPDPAAPEDAGRVRPPVASFHLHNLRDWSDDPKHGKVDDAPFGGGPGMVLRCQPVWDAVHAVQAMAPEVPATRVLFTPTGEPLTQPRIEQLAKSPRLLLICGHYEGFDQRVLDALRDEPQETTSVAGEASGGGSGGGGLLELSLGDFVLTGGELPAAVLIDAVVRLLPGALGHDESAHRDSFSPGVGRLLDHPHYTRPRNWEGREVPEVLLSGDHPKIEAWRQSQSEKLTAKRRPDLLAPTPEGQAAGMAVGAAGSSAGALPGAGSLPGVLLGVIREARRSDFDAIDALLREASGDAWADAMRTLRKAGEVVFELVAEFPGIASGAPSGAMSGGASRGDRLAAHAVVTEAELTAYPGRAGWLYVGSVTVAEPWRNSGGAGIPGFPGGGGLEASLIAQAVGTLRDDGMQAVLAHAGPQGLAPLGFELVGGAAEGASAEASGGLWGIALRAEPAELTRLKPEGVRLAPGLPVPGGPRGG